MRIFTYFLVLMLSINCAMAQWTWQNPLPQGNSFNSVFFPCTDTGYAVGDCGLVMKTVNAGMNWVLVELSDSIDFNDVFFIDSQNGFIGGCKNFRYPSGDLGILGILLATRDGGITWSAVNIPYTLNVLSVYFPNADTGYAGCFEQILKTTDGGYSWYSIAGLHPKDIFFINCNTGFASCQLANCGSFYKTTDGGLSWTETYMQEGGNSIYFINDSVGFVAQGGMTGFSPFVYWGAISKTTDGGLNWTKIIPDTTICFNSIYFISADTGYAVGITRAEEGFILKTTDGGDNWQTIVCENSPGLNSVFFTCNNTGYVAGSFGILWSTTDAGATWDGLPDGTTASLKSVCFTSENLGFAVGEHETILKTSDAGTNWTSVYSGTDRCMNSVYFTDATTGYIVGEQGMIYKTADAGINWSLKYQASQDLFCVHFPSVSTGYAVGGNENFSHGGSDGIIIKTTDNGENWTTIMNNPDESYKSVFFTDQATGFVVGNNSGFILKTTDGGETWVRTSSLSEICTIFFTDSQTGYAGGSRVYKTIDGGINWVSMNHERLYDIRSIFFPSKNIGYAACGIWFRGFGMTYNGGLDWELVETGTYNKLNSVYFTNDSTGYMVGDHGTILKTTNGGGSALSVKEIPKIQDWLSIYPNPASGIITINLKFPGTIQILSLNGQELLRQKNIDQTTQTDISTLSKGLYLLKVTNGKGVQVGKFIKQ